MMIYNTAATAVEPVFFAVVPDSFMTRDGEPSRDLPVGSAPDWTADEDVSILAPRDRWSF